MKAYEVGKVVFESLAAAGMDTLITNAYKSFVPKTYGVAGAIQNVCLKAASIGLSAVFAVSLDDAIEDLRLKAKEVLEEAEMKNE